uniref:Uncharacterized protein n=1 Tax=Chromera velia CCMP2878 TaxID=1169474 RepID=A0A0G4H2Y1_9ALVE|mmetsp:Transcript_42583/g.83954  ORF Transcript_42583/g.83954 Transcript_42583/m.83954 type:complete len:127 (+) Transcript_42583:125-505(+)|eukprot:Cvel_24485.t1-p1 / transcript=Cvel_24485.t1 / gene=Cvel_24485 / organism=Chromera_velia_CCMP2878 / gene_product=hypothetical protein / transcript_product=hypothetical protein / location=Cvel_scaffold2652:13691-14251(+) / protein_length=126 / sequence_SO=supercontig / SO=protein_coding / is_pseudo=false
MSGRLLFIALLLSHSKDETRSNTKRGNMESTKKESDLLQKAMQAKLQKINDMRTRSIINRNRVLKAGDCIKEKVAALRTETAPEVTMSVGVMEGLLDLVETARKEAEVFEARQKEAKEMMVHLERK